MLSDSSQFGAICAVDSGRDLVLEGPPGTGKSQTITNIIANTLAKGKTVLFVAEKVAALEVVHRRLTEVGLAPFCLELHSSKTKKTDVLAQLGKALEVSGTKTASEWEREADRLAALRMELNGLVDALHREHPNGLDVFSAIGTCIANAGTPPSAMTWADPNIHSRAELDKLRETTRRVAASSVTARSPSTEDATATETSASTQNAPTRTGARCSTRMVVSACCSPRISATPLIWQTAPGAFSCTCT